jgi:hypothetical protein
LSVTVIVNQEVPVGSGGGGSRLQLMPGIVSCGPDVTWEKFVATPYNHSQTTIVPGAVDALPSKVQLSVLPPFASVQVSDSAGPVTPKLAVATVALVTDRMAEADVPP